MKTFSFFVVTALLMACSGKTPDATAHMPTAPETAAGGDMYYDLLQKMNAGRNPVGMQELHTRIYLAAGGDARVERDGMNVMGHSVGGMVIIGNSSKPNESILIDDEKKTYTVNHFDENDLKGSGKITSTVSAKGEETILGYRSVHVRIISTKNYGGSLTTQDTLDLWKSKDVPVPAVFGDWMNRFESRSTGMLYSADIPEKLRQLGCVGFTTKMEMHLKSSSLIQTLVKAEKRDLAGSLFKVPSGYTETKE